MPEDERPTNDIIEELGTDVIHDTVDAAKSAHSRIDVLQNQISALHTRIDEFMAQPIAKPTEEAAAETDEVADDVADETIDAPPAVKSEAKKDKSFWQRFHEAVG